MNAASTEKLLFCEDTTEWKQKDRDNKEPQINERKKLMW